MTKLIVAFRNFANAPKNTYTNDPVLYTSHHKESWGSPSLKFDITFQISAITFGCSCLCCNDRGFGWNWTLESGWGLDEVTRWESVQFGLIARWKVFALRKEWRVGSVYSCDGMTQSCALGRTVGWNCALEKGKVEWVFLFRVSDFIPTRTHGGRWDTAAMQCPNILSFILVCSV